jgi:DNA (cytosine-5)-methyltransferase 1
VNGNRKTYAEICAGIGGFGLGFERAGWSCAWTFELDDVNRAVLADRFPGGRHLRDLRDWRAKAKFLTRPDVIAFGFPCTNISRMASHAFRGGSVPGLNGQKSGLFFEIMEIVGFFQPAWVVLENVPDLLSSNDHEDIARVIAEFANRNYVGYARVLNAQHFGIPQKRRRLFMVAGLGRFPSMEFLSDAAPVEAVPCSITSGPRLDHAFAGYTLTAPNKYNKCNSRINLGSELLVAEQDGWGQMVERERTSSLSGVPKGLDATNIEEAFAAGNAVPPPIAQWIAEILNRS